VTQLTVHDLLRISEMPCPDRKHESVCSLPGRCSNGTESRVTTLESHQESCCKSVQEVQVLGISCTKVAVQTHRGPLLVQQHVKWRKEEPPATQHAGTQNPIEQYPRPYQRTTPPLYPQRAFWLRQYWNTTSSIIHSMYIDCEVG
jgi:hypothetical protein